MDAIAALSGGDLRSIRCADEVASWIGADAGRAAPVLAAMDHDDPVVALRACDAIEKASRRHPALLAGAAPRLLALAGAATRSEQRWSLAQLLGRRAQHGWLRA